MPENLNTKTGFEKTINIPKGVLPCNQTPTKEKELLYGEILVFYIPNKGLRGFPVRFTRWNVGLQRWEYFLGLSGQPTQEGMWFNEEFLLKHKEV